MKKTVAEAEKTKISILDAGIRVFARVGFERATLENIGREAHLTRGAIYWHFRNKHDLFAQILRRENDRLNRLVASALSVEGTSFEKLRRLLDAVLDNFYDQEIFRQFIELTWYKLDLSHFVSVMDDKTVFVQNFLGIMERLLAESQADGDIGPEIDIRQAALHLSCLINGIYRLYHVAPDWARDKGKVKNLFSDFLDSLEEK